MKRKLIVLTLMILTVATLAGCKSKSAKELAQGINSGEPLELRAAAPTAYTAEMTGEKQAPVDFDVDIDKLTLHNENGFRVEFNKVFEINRISDRQYGNGLQGCLYTIKHEDEDITSGRACMADAFRNKAFIEEFWNGSNNTKIINRLNELSEKEYADVEKIGGDALYASLNLYWNLFADFKDKKGVYYCGKAPLTREEFYALAYRAQTTRPLEPEEYDPSTDPFTLAVCPADHDPVYLKYARHVDQYAWISTEDSSLNQLSIDKYITRAEAIYMIVMQNFPDLYEQAKDASPAYSDTTSNGDLAGKLGFKSSDGTGNKYWRAYTLKYMIDNLDKGMQSELYRAMVVAKALNLINDTKARYNEAISRNEAIQLIIDCQIAKNGVYKYATTAKNGKIVALVEIPKQEVPEEILERINRLTEEQLSVFEYVGDMYKEDLEKGKYTQEEVDRMRMLQFNTAAINGILVGKFSDLFPYWAYLNDYTDIYPTATLIGGKLAGENLNDDKSQGKGEQSKLSNKDLIQQFLNNHKIETDGKQITYSDSTILKKFTLQNPGAGANEFEIDGGIKIYVDTSITTEEEVVKEIEAESSLNDIQNKASNIE